MRMLAVRTPAVLTVIVEVCERAAAPAAVLTVAAEPEECLGDRLGGVWVVRSHESILHAT
jgi:hypothetical protein